MFCAKCGASLEDDAKKCDRCGAPVRIRPSTDMQTGESSLKDPVFYEDVTDEMDVKTILRMVRSRESMQEDLFEDNYDGADVDEEYGEEEIGSGDPQDVSRMPDEYREEDYYEDELPQFEKFRRGSLAARHAREEAADERAMQRHLKKAQEYYDRLEKNADQLREERARKAEALRQKRIQQDAAWKEQKWFEEALRKEIEEEQAQQRAREERRAREEQARSEAARERAEAARLEERQTKTEVPGSRKAAASARHAVTTEEESIRKAREARARRRAQEDAQSGLEIFLGRYGLSREMAVRLVTLFLIAILGTVYVMGRGNGSRPDSGSNSSEGLTGAPALAEPEAEDVQTSTDEEGTVPTGGGDF